MPRRLRYAQESGTLSSLDERAIMREIAEREATLQKLKKAVEPTVAELEAADMLEGQMFPKQRAFFFDTRSRRRCGRCTRRAGKTMGAARKFLITNLRDPESVCLYIAKTSGNAREYIWPKLKSLVAQYNLPFTFNEQALRMQHTRAGGKTLFRGADTVKDIEKLRGMALKVVNPDESGTFGAEMEDLIVSVIGPSLRDQNGELLLTGTPGYYPAGLFYEVSEGLRDNWINHRWSLADNPYLSDDAKNLKLIREEEGLTEDDPRYIREYLGEYAINTKTQMFTFEPSKNTYVPSTEPHVDALEWYLGVDFGWVDATAIVPVGFMRHSPRVWVPPGWCESQQTSDDVALALQTFIEKYKPKRIIGDVGGYGKAVAQQIMRDYNIFIEAAQKREKLSYIEFLNSAFLRGDVQIERGSTLARELPTVLWNEQKNDAHRSAKDNQAMALLYAWRQVYNIVQKVERRPVQVKSGHAKLLDLEKHKAIKDEEQHVLTNTTHQALENWYTRF